MIGKKAPRLGARGGGSVAVPTAAVLATPALGCLVLRYERPALLACCGGLLALLTVLRPAAALATLIPIGLLEAATSGGASLTFMATALVTLTAALRATATAGAGPLRPAHPWIGLLAGVLIVSMRFPPLGVAVDGAAASDIRGMLAGLALLAVVAANAPRPAAIVRVIAFAGTLAAAYALGYGEHADGRLTALGFNPNYLGGLLALPCVAAAGLARSARSTASARAARPERHAPRPARPRAPLHDHAGVVPAWVASAGVCLAAIIETQSRGAFLAAAAGLAVVLLQGRTGRSRLVCVLAAGLAGAGIVAGAVVAPHGGLGPIEHLAAGDRRPAELAYDTAVRGDAAEFAAAVAARHPIRGIGYGRFPSYAAADPKFGVYMATHDDYLRLAAEAGAAALAAFLVVLWLGVRGRRSGDLAVLRAVAVAYAIGLFFANPLANLVASLPFWLALGCLLASYGTAHDITKPAQEGAHEGGNDNDVRQPDGDPRGRALRLRQQLAFVHRAGR